MTSALTTLRELFRHNDWANERLLAAAAPLDAAALDQRVEMGPGSLRRTLQHIWHAEAVWLERWQGHTNTPWPVWLKEQGPAALREHLRATAAAREQYLDTLGAEALSEVVTYRDSRGSLFDATRGDMLIQAWHHSQHHRAQGLNMLRAAGAELPQPGLDYIYWRIADPGDAPPVCHLPTVRHLFETGDARLREVIAAALNLPPEAHDAPFDMGHGTLRETLYHIHLAERWWVANASEAADNAIAGIAALPLSDLPGLLDEFIPRRAAVLLADDLDTARLVEARMRSGLRRVPMSVVLHQLPGHGVHHRAQAVNMLRRLGGPVLEMDYMVHVRRPADL